MAVLLHQRAVGFGFEGDLGQQGDGQGVEDPGQDGEDERGPQAGQELLADAGHETPIAVRTTSMALIPTNGATRPPTP